MISPAAKIFDKFKTLLGVFYTLVVTLINIASIPVYVFRFIVIVLAKYFRPDLDEIMTGISALLVNDYFEKTPPRSNVIVTMVIQGHVTLEEIKSRVLKNWVGNTAAGEVTFEKFQQYPVKWCGFAFWKRASGKFCAENHIHVVHNSKGENSVTEEGLNDHVEKLLNARFPAEQSPWELHLVESYTAENLHSNQKSKKKQKHASVIILKVHHSLGDGFSLLTALLEGLCESSMSKVEIPRARLPQRSPLQNILHLLTAPVSGFIDMSYLLSFIFRNPPWLIADQDKTWYHVCARTEPISIKLVKDIKNFYGVSFSSVILSAYSTAVYKSLQNSGNKKWNKNEVPMLCLSAVPLPGYTQRRKLSNQFAAAVYELPVNTKFKNSVERLVAIHEMMEKAKRSAIPTLMQFYSGIAGAHFCKVQQVLTRNKHVSTGMSNFPGMLDKVKFNGKPVIDVDFVTGGQEGEASAAFTTFSYNQKIRLGMSIESALMSRADAIHFLKYATDEIQSLGLAMKNSDFHFIQF